jgi:hypothetical protein
MAIVKPLAKGTDGRRRLQLLSPATLGEIGTIDCILFDPHLPSETA